jgi:hypothetical protein
MTGAILEACQREIRIVHEDITDRDQEFNIARRILHDARRIYFLGFGFGTENVERLNFEMIMPEVCEGTGIGLTASEVRDIGKLFHNGIAIHNGMDCLALLRGVVDWT